jgi:hypothetical protein
MISGRENYARAIEFRGPEYLPCTVEVNLDWLQERDEVKIGHVRELSSQLPQDMLGWLDAARNSREPEMKDGVKRWVDEWDTGWADDGHGAKTESYPLLDGYGGLEGYAFPDPHLPGRFEQADQRLRERGEKYVRAVVWFTLFERLWMLRGFEHMLTDPYLESARFGRLRDRVVE